MVAAVTLFAETECSPHLRSLVDRVTRETEEAKVAIAAAVGFVARTRAKRHYRNMQPLPGFPVAVPCPGPREAKLYFAQPRLTCLLCGKTYALLPNHLTDTHGVTPDEYRAAYRLPWTAGLAGATVIQKKSAALIAKLADAEFASAWFADAERHRQAAHLKARNQREGPFRRERTRLRLQRLNKGPWEARDYLRILEVMKERDAVLRQVAGKVPGLPSYFMAVNWFNSTPDRKQSLIDTVHALSPAMQAKSGWLNPAVISRIRELRAAGRLHREIASEIGLCVMTVAKHLRDRRP